MWPSPFEEEQAAIPSWPGYRNTQRWTSTFDSEARATRMSFYVGDTLLPPPVKPQDQWAGQQNRKSRYQHRQTWMANMVQPDDEDAKPIWEGNFDVEKRQSFVSRSARSSRQSEGSWFRDSMDDEKFGKVRPRDPLTVEQTAQADAAGGLVPVEVLSYPFPGEGTEDDPYMVSWIENDAANPLNFPSGRKWMNALILALAVWTVSIASSGFSQGRFYPLGNSCLRPGLNINF